MLIWLITTSRGLSSDGLTPLRVKLCNHLRTDVPPLQSTTTVGRHREYGEDKNDAKREDVVCVPFVYELYDNPKSLAGALYFMLQDAQENAIGSVHLHDWCFINIEADCTRVT